MDEFLKNRLKKGLNQEAEPAARVKYLTEFAVEAAAILQEQEVIIKEGEESKQRLFNRIKENNMMIIRLENNIKA